MTRVLAGLMVISAVMLAVFGGRAISAQDKDAVQVPDGLAFAEFKGYESWHTAPAQQLAAAQSAAGESCHVPGGAERRQVLNAMRGAVEGDLRQPVIFKVSTIRVCGAWAFVVAEPLKPGGGEIKWQSTMCHGDVSHLVGALSQQDQSGAWRLKDYALCPTDVAWADWPEKYGAPQAVFAE